MTDKTKAPHTENRKNKADESSAPRGPKQPDGEVNGPKGPEPTRYGDWEVGGRCTDF